MSFKLKDVYYEIKRILVKDKLLTLAMLIFLICLFSGYLTFHLESLKENTSIDNFWNGFYWAIVTFTTTGYGDMTPETLGGRIFALILMLSSVILLAPDGPQMWRVDIPRRFIGKQAEELMEYFRSHDALLLSIVTEEKTISIEDILSDDLTAVKLFIKRKFDESQKKFSTTKTVINPANDLIITEFDSAVVIAETPPRG